MNVLLVHNYYQQPGGEDRVFRQEGALLESKGHHVVRYEVHNDEIRSTDGLRLALNTIWNPSSSAHVRRMIRQEHIDVMHVHNTFPLISPAIYYAARAEGVAVVQTLHNYRLLCPAATLFREGHPCEDCVGKALPWPGVVRACYRNDRRATGVTASMLFAHRMLRTWTRTVDRYIALTEFARGKFIEANLPADKLRIKPNFVHPDPGLGAGDAGCAMYVGRLSEEKGIETLLQAWTRLEQKVPLQIVGDGPLAGAVIEASKRFPGISWLGRLNWEQTIATLKSAALLIVPSIWYEALPVTILEAFAVGVPVVASDLGSLTSLIADGHTGYHFKPGDPGDLADKVAQLFSRPEILRSMRKNVREEYEAKYGGERNYAMLLEIYDESIRSRRREPPRTNGSNR
jgi:glycosyltransferase involved in cell wall biosynthesis